MKGWLKKALATLATTVVGSILYRMGGAAGYNTKFRDFGIPTVQVIQFLVWRMPTYNWTDLSLFLTFGATFGVQTTYWKKKGTDGKWYNWLLTGLGYSVCWLPTVLSQNIWPPAGVHCHWLGFGIRSVVCTCFTVLVSQLIGKDVMEENARGWTEVLTLPLLFIG